MRSRAMRRQGRILLATIALAPIFVWGPRLPEALQRMETFRVSEVEVRGARFLSEDSVVAQMQLGSVASAWGDTGAWVERLLDHPMVKSAEIRRRLPNGLRVTIEERQPVALAATPVLEPVDGDGHRLPIDPTIHRLDLPIIAASAPPEGSTLFPQEVRALVGELEHLTASDAEFAGRISSLRMNPDGSIVASLVTPDVDFLLLSRTPSARLREGEAALADAMGREPGRKPSVVDLRFADQVVVRRNRND